MKPGGQVNNFVVAAFCYHLFCRTDGHPDVSKWHYFFSNISVSVSCSMLDTLFIMFCLVLIFLSLKDYLLKDHDEVDGDVMMKAFQRSAKARPLYRSDLVSCKVFQC